MKTGYSSPSDQWRGVGHIANKDQNHSAGVAFIDDEFCPTQDAKISIFDMGFLLGDVTYDAVGVWKGSFFRLEDHLDRFERSLEGLHMNLAYDREQIREIAIECVRRSGLRESLVELVATRGATSDGRRDLRTCSNQFIAFAVPYVWLVKPEQIDKGTHVIVSSIPRIPAESIDPTIKNFNRLDFSRASFEAYEQGAEFAVLPDYEGNITEGLGYNVFTLFDGRLIAPDSGVLEGITCRTVMELCAETNVKAEYGKIKVDEFRSADEVFMASTGGGIMPITKVDDRVIGDGTPGPLTIRIKDLYWAWHDNPAYCTPVEYD